MEIYFLRHGLAGSRAEWDGPDSERPLTDQGKRRMRREAATLANLGLCPQVILTSPLVRAEQTAEIVAEALKMAGRTVRDERLSPGFQVDDLRGILADTADVGSLLLVGHEPDLSEAVSVLVGGCRLVLKKGALARVDAGDRSLADAELVWLLPPSLLAL